SLYRSRQAAEPIRSGRPQRQAHRGDGADRPRPGGAGIRGLAGVENARRRIVTRSAAPMSQQAAIESEQGAADQELVEDVVVKAKTSFYWAMRLLPTEKRQAMFAVYAFCCVVDDIADGDLPEAAKLRQLQAWREEIERLHAGVA